MHSFRLTATRSLYTFFLLAVLAVPAFSLGTPAGTVINCWSTATFTENQGSELLEATSNVVSVTVARKSAILLTPPTSKLNTIPGQFVVFPAEVRNNGNSSEIVNINSSAPSGWAVSVYLDDNGDGSKQENESTLVTQTPPMPPDSVVKLLVKVSVPANAQSGSEDVSLNARSSEFSDVTAQSQLSVGVNQAEIDVHLATNPLSPEAGQDFDLTVQLTPASVVQMNITATAPDGIQNTYSITTDNTGKGIVKINADCTGQWVFLAQFAGGATLLSGSGNLAMTCRSPQYIASGVDLINIPLKSSPENFDSIFSVPSAVNLYRWDPVSQGYKMYIPGHPIHKSPIVKNVDYGQALWLLSRSAITVTPTGRTVPQNQPFTMNLTAGWHQIGSPFFKSVALRDVKVMSNGITYDLSEARTRGILWDYCWTYTNNEGKGGYELVHATMLGALRTLDPWKGYWLNVAKDCTLVIDPTIGVANPSSFSMANIEEEENDGPNSDVNLTRKRRSPVRISPDEWTICLKAAGSVSKDSSNFLGISKAASLQAIAKAPRASLYTELSFPTSNGYIRQGGFATDFRASAGRLNVWEFEVNSNDLGGDHIVIWEGVERVPLNMSVILTDLQTGERVNMRTTSGYRFQFGDAAQTAKFQISVIATSLN